MEGHSNLSRSNVRGHSFRDLLAIAFVKSRRDCAKECKRLRGDCFELQEALQHANKESEGLKASIAELTRSLTDLQAHCRTQSVAPCPDHSAEPAGKISNFAEEQSSSLTWLHSSSLGSSILDCLSAKSLQTETGEEAAVSLNVIANDSPERPILNGTPSTDFIIQHFSLLHYKWAAGPWYHRFASYLPSNPQSPPPPPPHHPRAPLPGLQCRWFKRMCKCASVILPCLMHFKQHLLSWNVSIWHCDRGMLHLSEENLPNNSSSILWPEAMRAIE